MAKKTTYEAFDDLIKAIRKLLEPVIKDIEEVFDKAAKYLDDTRSISERQTPTRGCAKRLTKHPTKTVMNTHPIPQSHLSNMPFRIGRAEKNK